MHLIGEVKNTVAKHFLVYMIKNLLPVFNFLQLINALRLLSLSLSLSLFTSLHSLVLFVVCWKFVYVPDHAGTFGTGVLYTCSKGFHWHYDSSKQQIILEEVMQ